MEKYNRKVYNGITKTLEYMPKFLSKDFIFPNLLVIPMVSQWILPEGLEQLFFVNLLGIVFYLPNILYFIYIYLYKKRAGRYRMFSVSSGKKMIIVVAMVYFFAFLLCQIGVFRIDEILNIMINDFAFVYAFILFFYYPLPKEELDKTKYVVLFALVVICLEVMLFSTGTLIYTSSSGNGLTDSAHELGGIYRISTTVGGATGTGVVISLCGYLCSSFYQFNEKLKIGLLALISVAVFFTVSRGSILVWSMYLIVLLFREYLCRVKFSKKILYIIVFFSLGYIGYQNGIVDPIIKRQEALELYGDESTGRDERVESMTKCIVDYNFLGVGAGMIYSDKSINSVYNKDNNLGFSPHNSHLLILAELGIVGYLFFLYLYIGILKRLDYKKSGAIIIPFVFLITLNTENFPLYQECFPLITLNLLAFYKPNLLT